MMVGVVGMLSVDMVVLYIGMGAEIAMGDLWGDLVQWCESQVVISQSPGIGINTGPMCGLCALCGKAQIG